MTLLDLLDAAAKFSIVLGVLGYLHSRRALRLQHERARREKATSALNDFAKSMNARSAAARKLVRILDQSQVDKLYEGQEFSLKREYLSLLAAAIPEHIDESKFSPDKDIQLTRSQSYLLRWEIVYHLNCCEVLAQYWITDVAHKETIEEEMDILLGETVGENILTQCRRLAEKKRCPALHNLVGELERKRGASRTPQKLDE